MKFQPHFAEGEGRFAALSLYMCQVRNSDQILIARL